MKQSLVLGHHHIANRRPTILERLPVWEQQGPSFSKYWWYYPSVDLTVRDKLRLPRGQNTIFPTFEETWSSAEGTKYAPWWP